MKHIFISTKRYFYLFILMLTSLVLTGCLDKDPSSQYYYTFTGETIASYLSKDTAKYSKFVEILDRANQLDLLSTYGEYTCIAPTNAAIDSLLAMKQLTSVSQLTQEMCDTIANNHLIEGTYFTTDLEEGAMPAPNFLDRYLDYSAKADTAPSGEVRAVYLINKSSELLIVNDTVVNGVVHTINKIIEPSNLFLPQMMEQDESISIFVAAMKATGIADKLQRHIDATYSVGLDSTNERLTYYTGSRLRPADFPARRYFKYTCFVEPNSVYRAKWGVTDLQSLKEHLKTKVTWFDENGTIKYDDNYTDTTNYLYRFVAYHFINRLGGYDSWTVMPRIREIQPVWKHLDAQDFYETMCPYSIMKFQSTSPSDKNPGQLYINRRRINEGAKGRSMQVEFNPDLGEDYVYDIAPGCKGARVYTASESRSDQSALNGVYHYIDDIILYDENTAKDVLNTRIRMDATTLSPDFMNNVGRARTKPLLNRSVVTRYKPGYCTNFTYNDQTQMGLRIDPDWSPSYQCDALDVLGQYDFSVRIPPVPQGQYDVRFGLNMGIDRGVVQIYFKEGKNGSWVACDIPIDMRLGKYTDRVGAVVDDPDDIEANLRNDKDMKNRGYMKSMDSWYTGGGKTETHRQFWNSVRVVLTNVFIREGVEYYVRFKNVLDDPNGLLPFDYLELCPKSVYDNPRGEDTH